MRHADLRREAAAVIAAKPASALLYDTAVCCVVPRMGLSACGCRFCGGMSDAVGLKTSFDGQIQSKKHTFFGIYQSKRLAEKS